jgi:hypothetical protein
MYRYDALTVASLGPEARAAAARVDGVAAHGGGARHAVQLVVEAARVAHHLAARVASPDRGGVRAAVAARQLHAPRAPRSARQRLRRLLLRPHAHIYLSVYHKHCSSVETTLKTR